MGSISPRCRMWRMEESQAPWPGTTMASAEVMLSMDDVISALASKRSSAFWTLRRLPAS